MALMGVLLPQSRAVAHGAVMDYEMTRAIAITAQYDTGDPMAQAQVAVFSPDDPQTPWLTGTTDDEGNFIFAPDPDQPGFWDVQVRQAGHGQIVSIEVPDVASSANAAPDSSAAANPEPAAEDQAESAATGDESTPTDAPVAARPSAEPTPLQRGLMLTSVVWGFVGTALFFLRNKQ
ncbi:MAG: carboxypeptidase-like regulatory domain-containing protein [Kaiparowitsia implicata GSE-PSE-MK54-09C]|jgi:nickel transport protein|nr:carboxypeptidase-like regulatory domain-containing protein [Kaiparowitsia implicata GSE-PSE-MK54-09C]